MAQDDIANNEFSFDQPWNPISYFEEENESADPNSCQYSPSHLASLFESNMNAVDEDIARSKHAVHNITPETLFDTSNETHDIDELGNFTLETESGIKVLDTTLEINRKAIFSDFDRLKRWQHQAVNKSPDNMDDMFINEPSDHLFQQQRVGELKSAMDGDIENMLETLPNLSDSVLGFPNEITSLDEEMNVPTHSKSQLDNTKLQNFTNNTQFDFPIADSDIDLPSLPLEDETLISLSEDTMQKEDVLLSNTTTGGNILDIGINPVESDIETLLDDLLDLPDVPSDDPKLIIHDTHAKTNETDLLSLLPLPSSDEIPTENNSLNTNNGDNLCSDTNVEVNNTDIIVDIDDAVDNGVINGVINELISEVIVDIDSTVDVKGNIIDVGGNVDETDMTENLIPELISSHDQDDKAIDDLLNSDVTNAVDDLVDIANNITTNASIVDTNEVILDSHQVVVETVDQDLPNSQPDIETTAIELLTDRETSSDDKDTYKEDTNSDSIVNNVTDDLKLQSDPTASLTEFVVESSGDCELESHEETFTDESNVCTPVIGLNANICLVQQHLSGDSIQCLTPDNDENSTIPSPTNDNESEASDIEAYMTNTIEAVKSSSEIDGQLSNVDVEIQSAKCSNDTSESTAIDYADTTVTSVEASGDANVTSKSESSPQVETSSNVPVCFSTDDVSVRDDELDELMGTGDESSEDISLEHTISKEPSNAVVKTPEISTATAVVEGALAATAAPNLQADDGNVAENVEDVSNTDDVAIEEPCETSATDETVPSVSQTETPALQDTDDNSRGSNDQINEQTGRRTSLRNTASASNPSRHVRFSLTPQYEGDTSGNVGQQASVAGTSQQSEESAEGTPAGTGDQPISEMDPPAATNEQGVPEEPADVSVVGGATAAENPLDPNNGVLSEFINLGWVAPAWVPDESATNCMNCDMKFTMVKRRHHCRACGKVLCSLCCNMKYALPYLEYKAVRVCQTCCDIMVSTACLGPMPNVAHVVPSTHPTAAASSPPTTQPFPPSSHLPQAPPPYSEAVDGRGDRLSSVSSEAPPYSELSPTSPRFAEQPAPVLPASAQGLDIIPNGRPTFSGAQLSAEMMSLQLPAYTPSSRNNRNRTESEMSAVIMFNSTVTNLPPILRRSNEETRIVNNPDLDALFLQINDENDDPVSFIVNKNLVVRVKVINLDCCVEKRCWCFTSDGMGASNQEELVILVKCNSFDIDERTLARKVLQQMNAVFEKAKQGHPVSDLEHMEFEMNMRCMPKNVGMLFFKHSLQCLKKLLIPTSPYLFGLYVEKAELPWVKNFPLRLLLRVGAEFKYYPCPLFNVLNRTPVYDGVGRTILDLLADFRNFQYTIPRVMGVTINLRGRDTIIRLPQHRYDEIMKAVSACEENVLSLSGNFSSTCDGHLVTVEKDGRYKTQTLSIVLKANRKVTCASFIVISAALKLNTDGVKVKASIVEDGVMVQVTADVMKDFKQAIKDMKEFSVMTGESTSDDVSKVGIEWTSSDVMDRPRLLSPIDGTSFDNLTNMKIRHSYDYTSNNLTAKIHWVEVYFLPQDNDTVQRLSARELGQMTSSIAKACMSALSSHLMALIALNMTRIGLRVNLAADFVEYKIGSDLSTLPVELLPNLDDKLVPAIHTVMSSAQERVAVELIFQVVKIV